MESSFQSQVPGPSCPAPEEDSSDSELRLLRRSFSTCSASSETSQNAQFNANSTTMSLRLESSVEPDTIEGMMERYCGLLSIFAYDKAHEYAEKQHCQKGGDPTWISLAMVMIQLATFEKQYMNLAFLAPKSFLRKDSNLKGVAEHIKSDLKKFTGSSLANIANEFLVFIGLRVELMEFYEKLCLLGSAKNVEIVDLVNDFEILQEKRTEAMTRLGENLLAAPSFKCLEWEIEMLFNLLKSHAATKLWDFFGTMITIQEAQKMVIEWGEHLQVNQLTKKSGFLKSGSSTPTLYTWLLKFKATQLSKLSFYFFEILAENSNSAFDIRLMAMKLHTDYFTRVSMFQKRTDAHTICLALDARDIPFFPIGYRHPGRPPIALKGMDTFPPVLSIPIKPATHWPNIVMLMTDSSRVSDLNADKLVGFFDPGVQSTYFILRIEPRIFFVSIYESKKSEKDSTVHKFMNEIAVELRCGKTFSSLKHSSK